MDPFNISNRERFIEFISPDEGTKGQNKKIKPPYSIFWQSLTTDVGPVEHKSRHINVRHVNGYLIIPGIVYLLSTKLQKAVLNDRLGDKLEMNLIRGRLYGTKMETNVFNLNVFHTCVSHIPYMTGCVFLHIWGLEGARNFVFSLSFSI